MDTPIKEHRIQRKKKAKRKDKLLPYFTHQVPKWTTPKDLNHQSGLTVHIIR